MAREFTTVGVVGLGTMGAGIAEVFARNGFAVVGLEQSPEQVEAGRGHVQSSTDRAVKRGRLAPEDQQAILDRMTLTTSVSDLADCDLVVEAVIERLDLKVTIFRELDDIVRPDAVLATNTSSLSVTEIAATTSHPGRVIGMHFFNPAPVQRLVEVVHTVVTDPQVVADVTSLARSLGKNPVSVGDRAGFIANALLFGYLNHAVAMYESRYASREDIDAAMRLGCGYPMGPLALLDLIGLDTADQILRTMYAQSGDRMHAPAPLLTQLVTAGLLGRKTGRGFYTYQAPHRSVVVDDGETPTPDSGPPPGRHVGRVGVVGAGATAEGILEVLAMADVEVASVPEDSLDELAGVDLVIEAVADVPEAKRALFRELGRVCRPGAVLATTATSLAVIELAAASGRPADVVGLHVLDPVPATELVEVVSTVATAPEAAETVQAVWRSAGRYVVSCADRAGFVVDALLFPYLNDAVRMLEGGYASADDIDTAMTQGCALPKGPFEVLDDVGTDVALARQHQLHDEVREPGLAPAPLLRQLVTAGHLGRRAGRGFRAYAASPPEPS